MKQPNGVSYDTLFQYGTRILVTPILVFLLRFLVKFSYGSQSHGIEGWGLFFLGIDLGTGLSFVLISWWQGGRFSSPSQTPSRLVSIGGWLLCLFLGVGITTNSLDWNFAVCLPGTIVCLILVTTGLRRTTTVDVSRVDQLETPLNQAGMMGVDPGLSNSAARHLRAAELESPEGHEDMFE